MVIDYAVLYHLPSSSERTQELSGLSQVRIIFPPTALTILELNLLISSLRLAQSLGLGGGLQAGHCIDALAVSRDLASDESRE